MRAAPTFQISLHRQGMWRTAVGLLAATSLASTAAWLAMHEHPLPAHVPWLAAVVAGSVLALFASMMRWPVAGLRRDASGWQLTRGTAAPEAGELMVAIDLGPWMLLRFRRFGPSGRVGRFGRFGNLSRGIGARTVWLPAQRRGLESQWHALRCAVYSTVPATVQPVQQP